jgi:16S rRNA (uracil1498-N3)-methyltransferase
MHFFFREEYPLKVGEAVALSDLDLNHAFRVLRLKPDDQVVIADGLGQAFRGRVIKTAPKEILILPEAEEQSFESPLEIVLCPSLLKGEKMDLVIRQAVELGVYRIVPLVTARSIPQRDEAREVNRLRRWRSIARSAAAQCRRAFLPPVDPVRTIGQLIAEAEHDLILAPWEEDQICPLSTFKLEEPFNYKKALFLLIGPEGGFEAGEIEELKAHGAFPVNLGPRILRSDTAAAAALTLVQAAWGDFSRRVG